MEDRLLIDTKEINNHRIRIYYDADPMCPCTDWDMSASYLWEYNDFARLSDSCNWKEVFGKNGNNRHSLADTLCQLVRYHVKWKDLLNYFKKGKVDGYRMRYDRSERMWYLEWYNHSQYTEHRGYREILSISPSELYECDYTDEFTDSLDCDELIQILSDLGNDIFVKEWSTTGYSQGDYVEGVAFCTKERYTKMVSADTTDWKNKIDALIDSEVECIGMWMWGDVKGYVLEKKIHYTKHYQDSNREDEEDFDWDEVGSCWGFFMKTEELIEEIISEYNLKEAV